ncbi:hypothetical protein [Lentilactobacillus kefiri]|nr:hypothetical protein [Lentilactobacillus hilgardii]MCP9351020.1 hypothetical protein [Lentilactobacillus hilgardii]MCP9353697.1 hypothetical protein [Lentilactobacillus hilgardii]
MIKQAIGKEITQQLLLTINQQETSLVEDNNLLDRSRRANC